MRYYQTKYMKTKLKIFLSFLVSIGFLIGAIIITIQMAHIELETNQSLIDSYSNYLAFMIVLYFLFLCAFIYGIVSLYIQYKKREVEKYNKQHQ